MTVTAGVDSVGSYFGMREVALGKDSKGTTICLQTSRVKTAGGCIPFLRVSLLTRTEEGFTVRFCVAHRCVALPAVLSVSLSLFFPG